MIFGSAQKHKAKLNSFFKKKVCHCILSLPRMWGGKKYELP